MEWVFWLVAAVVLLLIITVALIGIRRRQRRGDVLAGSTRQAGRSAA